MLSSLFATRGAAAPSSAHVCVRCVFATALLEEQRACICTAAGWFLGRREARADRFCKDSWVERHCLLTSSVAALSAEDLTVRRGATRPDAPWSANAIAAHFMIAMLCRSYTTTCLSAAEDFGWPPISTPYRSQRPSYVVLVRPTAPQAGILFSPAPILWLEEPASEDQPHNRRAAFGRKNNHGVRTITQQPPADATAPTTH